MNRIKQLRMEKDIKQDVLAKLLGLEVAGISKLETGRVPLKDEYIIKLADYFEVSTDYLLCKSDIRKPDAEIKQEFDFAYHKDAEGLTDEERYIKLLDEMKNVDDDKRSAHFTSSICCILPDGSKITADGICEGKIGYEPIGKDGFGYDPIFMLDNKSFAELSAEEKDAVSHRGKALRELKAKLEYYFKNN